MGIIHKTLRKLQHDLNKEDAALRSGKNRNVYTFRRVIFSSLILIGAALLLGGAAVYILHGTGDSSTYPEKNKQRVLAEKSTEREPNKNNKVHSPATIYNETGKKVSISNPEAGSGEDIPTHIKEAPQKEVIQGKRCLPISKNEKMSSNDKTSVRCRPAGSLINADKHAVTRESAGDFSSAPKEKAPSDDMNKKKEKVFGSLYKKNRAVINTENEKISVASDIRSNRQDKSACGLKQGTTQISIHKKGDAVNKSAKISRLIAGIQTDIRSGNDDKVETLINRLALLIGAENDYIIKLKAYRYITQGNYERASSLLGSVLKKRKNDLEAGINMAILEIKKGRVDQARKRLQKLRNIYKENTTIPDLLRKIS